jgi:hypothetical protein
LHDDALQVSGKVFEAITLLAGADGPFLKKDAFIAITGLVDKIADSKLKPSVFTGLMALAEAVGPQFVFTQVHKKALAHKSPKVWHLQSTTISSIIVLFHESARQVKQSWIFVAHVFAEWICQSGDGGWALTTQVILAGS